jgi:hypothetical protein
MTEDRLVTAILWVVLIAGAACLVGVYFATPGRQGMEPPVSLNNQTETEPSDAIAKRPPSYQVPSSGEAVELPGDQPTREPTLKLPSTRPLATVYETRKPNGSFERAQEITEGVIIGKRGSKGDRADYYKVRALGEAMILKVETSTKDRDNGCTLTVFDADQQLIGEDLDESDSPLSLSVTTRATYYIKVDLAHAPVTTPRYLLHLYFH